jgi:predicted Zn-dependent protease
MSSARIHIPLLACLLINGYGLFAVVNGTAQETDDKNAVTRSIASDIYTSYLGTHKILTLTDNPNTEAVNRIASRVMDGVKKYLVSKNREKDLAGFSWEVRFIAETKQDAWCLPGGKMAVYAALLPLTQSDASLAVVLSHEIAHLLLKHGDTRMKKYLKTYLSAKDLPSALAANRRETLDFFRMAYGTGDYVGVIRGFDPPDEYEADELGAIIMAFAGYNPTEAIVFWERMGRLSATSSQPILVSTHPVTDKRLLKLKEIMDDIASKYYHPSL